MNHNPGSAFRRASNVPVGRFVVLVLLAFHASPGSGLAALPKRLILALDGIAYRDIKALQAGVTYTNLHGKRLHRQAFHHGYFPVSRMISTFPSASDVAWTEVFGNSPLPGYQRTYFSRALNLEVHQNPITTTMEYERQMTWQVTSGFLRTLGYVFPKSTFKYEVHELVRNFLTATNGMAAYYALLRSPDDAQHLSADIFVLLCSLDDALEKLRSIYRAREGRELEILILSDHGNNHAGPARRVEIRPFLKRAGYRIAKSIRDPKDIVLPTAGIESWVEIHNCPRETGRLVQLLARLEGVDLVTAQDPDRPSRFLVANSQGEQADIEWNSDQNSFRYSTRAGDPINYASLARALSEKKALDANGFGTADAWMSETLDHRYPLALERIVWGHTRAALNPATILISLKNDYVHAGWFVKMGSEFVRFGGTHGAMDDLNSNGILLSSFAATPDTSANRVAMLFGGFEGLRAYRTEESGAEWVSTEPGSLSATSAAYVPAACARSQPLLRVWTPTFASLSAETPVEVTVKKARQFLHARIRNGDAQAIHPSQQHLALKTPVVPSVDFAAGRFYAIPGNLVLQPGETYMISGYVRHGNLNTRIFKFAFQTDTRGLPVAY